MFRSKKQTPAAGLPSAAVFVDFEHWYISLKQSYGLKPDIKGWYEELRQKYELREITFFADFSHNGLHYELNKIRAVTHLVIDTQNANGCTEKDYTDFIMLDHIYRKSIISPDIDVFVLFTGDGHFCPALNYLKLFCNKKVAVYGINKGISNALRENADSCTELPVSSDRMQVYYRIIAENFIQIRASHRIIRPTFQTTVEAVCKQNDISQASAAIALREMLDKGFLFQKEYKLSKFEKIKVIEPDFSALKEAGIIHPDAGRDE